MALDHYVSQVYLRNFGDPRIEGRLRAYRKSDGLRFDPRPQDICRIEEGNTNQWLDEPRAVEQFLVGVEPKYNSAVANLRMGDVSTETVSVIAGFAAFVGTCSPAAMRLHSDAARELVAATAAIDRSRSAPELPPAPAELGGKHCADLLESGEIRIDVNPKFPQAHGITRIPSLVSSLGNSQWEVLLNPHPESPFFTSDFPLAIESIAGSQIKNRLLPLAPDLTVRIRVDPARRPSEPDLSFSNFEYLQRKPGLRECRHVNRAVARSGEELVLFNSDLPWAERFLHRHARYRIETTISRQRESGGLLSLVNLEHRQWI